MSLCFRSAVLGALIVIGLGVAMPDAAFALGRKPSTVSETDVSISDYKTLLAKHKPLMTVDVRQKEEYDVGHIDNAVLIPLNELPNRLSEVSKDKEVVVYCRSGRRSSLAVAYMRSKGYQNAVNLAGGYQAWESGK